MEREQEIVEMLKACEPKDEMTMTEMRALNAKIPNAKSFLIEVKKRQENSVSQLRLALKRFRAEKLLALGVSKAKADPILDTDPDIQALEDKYEVESLFLSWLRDVIGLLEDWSLHIRKAITLEMEDMRGMRRE